MWSDRYGDHASLKRTYRLLIDLVAGGIKYLRRIQDSPKDQQNVILLLFFLHAQLLICCVVIDGNINKLDLHVWLVSTSQRKGV